jgi:carbon starvation protein
MNSLTLLIAAACIFVLAYRYYAAFITAKILMVDENRPTPAHRLHDGKDYVPTNRFVLFGHHFAAISGAGPLLGPVLAAQWGVAPSALWLIIGAVVAGGVHDLIILFASVRLNGMSLSHIAGEHISRFARLITSIAILFIIVTALAGLAMGVVNALADSPWGVFSITATIPAAILVGLYLHVFRRGKVVEASIIGVVLVVAAVIFGGKIASSSWASALLLDKNTLKILLPVYGFIASVLPVWLLLCPRDYLSSWMKIGTILLLAVGIIFVHPQMKMPMITNFAHGGGPVVPGMLWPFLFITIMCGAISGFHSLIGSGTTPKMISSERDLRFIGYGAMLMESFVGVMALIAATTMLPYDYFAINAKDMALIPSWAAVGGTNLSALTTMVGEQSLQGRTGGAVSLAVGMASIFSALPGMKSLMAYWYHFAIMFEALFILTAVDTGTRVARFIVNELARPASRPEGARASWTAILVTSACASGAWGLLLWGNDIATIWPMFGVANQLLAAIALAIGTSIILRVKRPVYALVTFVPFMFVLATTSVAGALNITQNYLPKQIYVNAALTAAMMVLTALITIEAVRSWVRLLRQPQFALTGVPSGAGEVMLHGEAGLSELEAAIHSEEDRPEPEL